MNFENLFDQLSLATQYDWLNLSDRPLDEALIALQQGLQAVDGIEETALHLRMRIFRAVRKGKLWEKFIDPEVGEPFVDPRRWVKWICPKSTSYALKAWDREEALQDIPMTHLAHISGANIDVLKEVSTSVRKKPAVLKAAREMTADGLRAHLTAKEGQHLAGKMVLVEDLDEKEFNVACEMARVCEDCQTRAQQRKALAVGYIQEHAVEYEHRVRETA
jgi:hypothetical protein